MRVGPLSLYSQLLRLPLGVTGGYSPAALQEPADGGLEHGLERLPVHPPPPPPRDALEGKGPQRRLQRRLDRRLEEGAQMVGGGYCRLHMPFCR